LLVYPSLSMRVLRTFACGQIGKVWVLRFDRAVECYTTKWYVASFMMLGVPIVSRPDHNREKHRLGGVAF
jgi:hypothetical protein